MVGISSLCMLHYSLEIMLETVEDVFSHVEIICEGNHCNLEVLHSCNFEVTFHAPFSDLNLASLNEAVLKESLKQISENIEMAAKYNAEVVCIHPGHYSPLSIHFKEKAHATHIHALKELSKKAEEYSISLGIENMPYFPILCGRTPEEIREILEKVNSPHLGFTFDVGHANITGNVHQFLALKDEIVTVHLHDNSGDRDTHQALGEGTVPSDIYRTLEQKKSTIEVYTYADAVKSLQFLKKLT